MTAATELLSNHVLLDPQNSQVRDALPQLENTERIAQLCIIEALSSSAFAPTLLRGLTLDAPDAAFRVARNWYALRFSCTVAPSLDAVAAYRFAMGGRHPRGTMDGARPHRRGRR